VQDFVQQDISSDMPHVFCESDLRMTDCKREKRLKTTARSSANWVPWSL